MFAKLSNSIFCFGYRLKSFTFVALKKTSQILFSRLFLLDLARKGH